MIDKSYVAINWRIIMKHSGLTALQTLSILAKYNQKIKKLYDKAIKGELTPIVALREARKIENIIRK